MDWMKQVLTPVSGANNGIKTVDLDNLCAETCAYLPLALSLH